MSKVKVVLDADVIIHFSKGGYLSILPTILSGYEHIILDKVYEEIKYDIKAQLDNQINLLRNITVEKYTPKGAEMVEFAKLLKDKGKGESACLAYCRFNQNVIGSSNLSDIKTYCQTNNITYLTTLDFLYFAIQKGIMSVTEADAFIQSVIKKDSILPNISMTTFTSNVTI
ncbi:hypothetical protein DMA11_14470 [Marinilabiliaceae bacterium JC017]|nr:hypothetical protein DMA11_14470 [Marinilabiliaceae bacterium JC017]